MDDAKVSDHHAIIPTVTSPDRVDLSADERKIYDLVCRRLLTCWHEDHVWSVTTVITSITNATVIDRYHSSGKAIQQVGWKVLDFQTEKKKASNRKAKAGEESSEEEQQALPAGLARGQAQDVLDAEAIGKKTRAPKRFTEATLLTAMETAGKTLDEKELSDAMKETGLGTPATRASIIEVLLKREYIVRNAKNSGSDGKGHPIDRGGASGSEEPGDDGAVGSLSEADRAWRRRSWSHFSRASKITSGRWWEKCGRLQRPQRP